MNRRAFLRGLLGAAVCAVARFSPLVSVVPRERLTLIEWGRRTHPDGHIARLAKQFAAFNRAYGDLVLE